MHQFSKNAISTYTVLQLYELISNVKYYNEFVPWCEKIRILNVNDNAFQAEMLIDAFGIISSYVSDVQLSHPTDHFAKVTATSNSGPFHEMTSAWHLTRLHDGNTDITFYMQFQMKSKILEIVANKLLPDACDRMMLAFIKRADELYGKRSAV